MKRSRPFAVVAMALALGLTGGCRPRDRLLVFELTGDEAIPSVERVELTRGSARAVHENLLGVPGPAAAPLGLGLWVGDDTEAAPAEVVAYEPGRCAVGRATVPAVAAAKDVTRVAVKLTRQKPVCETELGQACADAGAVVCRLYQDCYDGLFLRAFFRDFDGCVDAQRRTCIVATEGLIARVQMCLTTLRGLPPNACAQALQLTTGDPFPGCEAIQRGTRQPGAACAADAQCESGRCAITPGDACGRCVARPGLHQPCVEPDNPCAFGLRCALTRRCELPVKAGSACGVDVPCEQGSTCVGVAVGSAGVCTPNVGEGAPCNAEDLLGTQAPNCRDDLFCNPVSKVCDTVRVSETGACGIAANGTLTTCPADGICSAAQAGTCRARPGLLEPCQPSANECADVQHCVQTSSAGAAVCRLPNLAACL